MASMKMNFLTMENRAKLGQGRNLLIDVTGIALKIVKVALARLAANP